MKTKITIIALFFVVTFLSCSKCRKGEFIYSAPNEIAESYCKNMIPGNYWIYSNQDNTKTDSLYFTYVPGEKQGEYIVEKMCTGWYQRIMHLHSKYLFEDELNVRYSTSGVAGETNLSVGRDNDFLGSFLLRFYPTKEKCLESTHKNKTRKMVFMDYVKVGSTVYHEVINVNDDFLIAPAVGLIQYTSYNQVDTFYLEKMGHENNNN